MQRITDPDRLQAVVGLRDAAADGPYDLRAEWLSATGSFVLAQEAASRIDPDQIERIIRASAVHGIGGYIAVSNDDAFVDPTTMAFEVDVTQSELHACSDEFFGLNMMLLAPDHAVALLSTVDDYSILAGPRAFILGYEPDIDRALEEFRSFALQQIESLRPAALRALETFESRLPTRSVD
ncbi:MULTISPECIES: hypothetical protein [unclassified Leifsonia]|uniref:hypothetical protein n=1 Tax=unclassified Leifsonia TaxID=2663824 RepID=UPI00036B3DD6|nr:MULTISPECIES: hypothetical protein [unclassified Leifsonia]TDP99258.1 hypothetical protein AXZ95_3171 [Leifsonia sp. 115AMFTsu3.1]